MKTINLTINNQPIEADELEVGVLYRHIASDTYWKIWSITPNIMGAEVDLELRNSMNEAMNRQVVVTFLPVIANKGTFEEIGVKEWKERG